MRLGAVVIGMGALARAVEVSWDGSSGGSWDGSIVISDSALAIVTPLSLLRLNWTVVAAMVSTINKSKMANQAKNSKLAIYVISNN